MAKFIAGVAVAIVLILCGGPLMWFVGGGLLILLAFIWMVIPKRPAAKTTNQGKGIEKTDDTDDMLLLFK